MPTSQPTEQPSRAPAPSQLARSAGCERLSRQAQPSQTTGYKLDLTVFDGRDLKNVNWRAGPLKPYVIAWVDPNHKIATTSDDFSNTKPVWNQSFVLPIPATSMLSLSDVFLTLEVYHSINSECPRPFVGSLRVLVPPQPGLLVETYDLYRRSGRPQGEIRLRLAVMEQQAPQNYQNNPYCAAGYPVLYQYPYPYLYLDPYSYLRPYPCPYPYYPGSPSVMSLLSERNRRHGANLPSAPAGYHPYDIRTRTGNGQGPGTSAGLGVEAVSEMLDEIVLNEGLENEENIGDRVEDDDDVSTSSSWTADVWE